MAPHPWACRLRLLELGAPRVHEIQTRCFLRHRLDTRLPLRKYATALGCCLAHQGREESGTSDAALAHVFVGYVRHPVCGNAAVVEREHVYVGNAVPLAVSVMKDGGCDVPEELWRKGRQGEGLNV